MLARDVYDPGIGFVTITRVQVTPDLQIARVYYTVLGDEKARRTTERALGRAAAFLRRQIGSRLRLKRVPVAPVWKPGLAIGRFRMRTSWKKFVSAAYWETELEGG